MATTRLAIAVAAALWSSARSYEMSLVERISANECWGESVPSDMTLFPPQVQAESNSEAADLFDIHYAPSFKVIVSRLAKEQYVLVQCGQERPSHAEVDELVALESGYTRKNFTVPLQSAMAMSTVQLGFLDALNVQDRVVYVSGHACAPCWQKAISCGSVVEDSFAPDFDSANLAAQQSGSDAVFVDCGSDCSNVHAMANGVHVPTSEDSGALATAEYIKYVGAFFNKEHAANELYAAMKVSYEGAFHGVDGERPIVAWVSYTDYGGPSWNQSAITLSQATYKMDITTQAGGKNVDAATLLAGVDGVTASDAVWGNPDAGKTYTMLVSDFADKAAAVSALFGALGTINALVDETYAWDPSAYTFDSFLSGFGLEASSSMKFIQDKMVLRVDRTLSESNGLDWFESRVSHPNLAVEGLARELHHDTSKTARYFRNIAIGQVPDQILTKDTCKKPMPVCDPAATAEIIETPGPTSMTEENQNSDGLGNVHTPVLATSSAAFFAVAMASL